jgi:hypothetical protein
MKKLFFTAAEEQILTPREMWHLRKCEECREVRAVFRRIDSLRTARERAQYLPKKAG